MSLSPFCLYKSSLFIPQCETQERYTEQNEALKINVKKIEEYTNENEKSFISKEKYNTLLYQTLDNHNLHLNSN